MLNLGSLIARVKLVHKLAIEHFIHISKCQPLAEISILFLEPLNLKEVLTPLLLNQIVHIEATSIQQLRLIVVLLP